MKFRKLLLISVVMLLVIVLTAGTALAVSPWIDVETPGNGKANQVKVKLQDRDSQFPDVGVNHWANKRIKAMTKQGIVKGYANGLFRPNACVSRIEALAMIVRLTEDADDSLQDALDGRDFYTGVPLWGQGYVAVAEDAGILEEEELENFRPMAAAKRYQVVIWLGRALDIDADDSDYELNFRDLGSIPEEALDYLDYLVENEIITGYHNGNFLPNKPVTRAEMANILSKVADVEGFEDEDFDIDILDQFKAQGKIIEIEGDTLVLKVRNVQKEFSLSDDVVVFLDGQDSDIGSLEEGFKAIVLYSAEDGENEALVVYARSIDDEDIDEEDVDEDEEDEADAEEVEGIFLSTDEDNIEVLVDGNSEEYSLSEDVEVEIDGEEAVIDDLVPGMEVELEIEDEVVVGIKADELDDISCIFVEIDDDEIIVEVDGEEFTFELGNDVVVEIDGEEAEPGDLEDGMEVELEFEDGEVVKIEAED